ncbi:hypothetical protein BG011_000763 [Mortierella polycephala]|uniref:Uncharacterized protein n=1 Tax=Mortierella polycephala TaxID=41804 RepID=A0A9P6PK22_9FUNG|nr:hypothetical protein BG011_000763 [Mortierella polycephala]
MTNISYKPKPVRSIQSRQDKDTTVDVGSQDGELMSDCEAVGNDQDDGGDADETTEEEQGTVMAEEELDNENDPDENRKRSRQEASDQQAAKKQKSEPKRRIRAVTIVDNELSYRYLQCTIEIGTLKWLASESVDLYASKWRQKENSAERVILNEKERES